MSYKEYKAEDHALLSQGCVVVDFSAEWCGPCKRMEPIFKKLAQDFDGKAKFFKVDVDQHVELSTKYNISSIPSFIFLQDGKEIKTHTGSLSEADFSNLIRQIFSFAD